MSDINQTHAHTAKQPEEETPLLTSTEPSQVPPNPYLAPNNHPRAFSSLIAAHRESTRRNGMLWVAELGILIWLTTIWVIAIYHPAGIFTFHPTLQSLSVLFFYQGIIILQPTGTPSSKRAGLWVHEAFQLLGSLSIIIGTSVIIYNKIAHSAPHFTSWHGLLGFVSTLIVLIQSSFGALIGFETSRDRLLGEANARKLWKYHRASGYLLVCLMTATVLAVTKADWVVMVTSKWSIWIITISPIVALIGLISHANMNKIFGR